MPEKTHISTRIAVPLDAALARLYPDHGHTEHRVQLAVMDLLTSRGVDWVGFVARPAPRRRSSSSASRTRSRRPTARRPRLRRARRRRR